MSYSANLSVGINCKASAINPSPLAPSSAANTVITPNIHAVVHYRIPAQFEGKESSAMENKSWLSKICSKLCSKHRGLEKCEKCGQRSDTCLPNPSFVSNRKHFLCQACRASSRNMKNMYHQLCRNLSLREHSRTTTCNRDDLSSKASCHSGVARSNSLKVRPTSPESGYETATSLDSSRSNVCMSADMSMSSGECRHCSSVLDSGLCTYSPSPVHHDKDLDESKDSSDNHVCSKDRTEVFGGAFKSKRVHLHQLQQFQLQERTYAKQSPIPQQQTTKVHRHAKDNATTKQYDGYLEIRTPKSRSMKYVFKKPESGEVAGYSSELQNGGDGRKHCENLKQCYRCHKLRDVAFRAPFGNGWLCEDCVDDLM